MATLLAMILSSILAYLPIMLLGDRLSDGTQLVVSFVVGLVSFAWLQWWLRRLKGG